MATKTLITLLAILTITPAFAAKQHAEPPARFRTFSGEVVKHTVPNGGAYKLCRELSVTYYGHSGGATYYPGMLGCAIGGKLDGDKTCYIVTTKGKPHVTRHEIAHCAGWPSHHPR